MTTDKPQTKTDWRGRVQIRCPDCGHRDCLQKVAIDDSDGYPYWGYPVCSKCQKSNTDFRYLVGCQQYVSSGFIKEGRLLLRKVNND